MASSSQWQQNSTERRLFVSRLSPYTKKEKLLEVFRPYGVEHAVVMRKTTGNCAFLTFATLDGTRKALAAADVGIICHKRKLRVLMADSWHSSKLIPPRPDVTPFPGIDLSDKIPLPTECIAKIASYLPFADRGRLEMVSRRWRQGSLASYHHMRHIDLNNWCWPNAWEGKLITTNSFHWLMMRVGACLKSIGISEESLAKNLKPQVMAIAIKNCPGLESLDLTAVTIRPSALREMEPPAPRLTCLKLGKCDGPVDPGLFNVLESARHLRSFCALGTDITGRSLLAITKDLQQLTLHDCIILKPENLSKMLQELTSLEYLDISKCDGLIDHTILQVLIDNINLHATLTIIKFHFCSFKESVLEIEMEEDNEAAERGEFVELELGPVEMAVSFPCRYKNVTSLSLTFCGWVASGLVSEIALHMQDVTSLNISGCTNIKGEFTLEPLRQMQKLRILSANNMHPSVGGWFLQFLKGLVEVHCRENQGISDEDICGMLRQCPEIAIVDVERCQNIGKPVLTCAYEVVTRAHRTEPIHLYIGGLHCDNVQTLWDFPSPMQPEHIRP
ncbi:putative RNA-binding protein EEED8.10 [Andrena cerasifolii]|uniref:putative RNA-binding protein EEED8.10 n=1 Tax=Andrena cerasifolii TaxID=2819439 RepID=UPI004037F64E